MSSLTKTLWKHAKNRGTIHTTMPLMLVIVSTLTIPAAAWAAVFDANNVAQLIAAINSANANSENDTIILVDGVYELSKVNNNTFGANGLPAITSGITIRGAPRGGIGGGGDIQTTIRRSTGAPDFRILYVSSSGSLTLDRLGISDGISDSGGGGIRVNGGKLFLLDSAVTDNSATDTGIGLDDSGGGIFNSGGTVFVVDSTLSRNDAGFLGGGIFSSGTDTSNSDLLVLGSTVSGNTARRVGGIQNQGRLFINNSTISGNTGEIQSGGIGNTGDDAKAFLRLVTVANNTTKASPIYSGGISSFSANPISVRHTILAGNTTNTLPSDCAGTLSSQGYNLVGALGSNCNFVSTTGDQVGTSGNPIDPELAPLSDDSEGNHPTETHALLPGSPAIDRIPRDVCVKQGGFFESGYVDQRQYVRPVKGEISSPRVLARCDIGAYEVNAKPACGFDQGEGLFLGFPLAATIVGDAFAETIDGTDGPDRIHGLGGNDTINGLQGDDILCGGPGEDTLNGGADNDRLSDDDGENTLKGGADNDNLSGGPDNDKLFGNAGDDRLLGNDGEDALNGGPGTDKCIGGANDTIAPSCEM